MQSSEVWSIIQAISGVYCALMCTVAWLFPRAPKGNIGLGANAMRTPPLFVTLGFAALGLSVAIPAIYRVINAPWAHIVSTVIVLVVAAFLYWLHRNRPLLAALQIHSAVYGTGSENDHDVATILRSHSMNGLVIDVNNIALQCDPSPGRTKRLVVRYSYGNGPILEVRREEYKRLILPEDKQFIEETAEEYARQIRDHERRLDETVQKYNEAIQEKQRALARERQAVTERDQALERIKTLEAPLDPSGGLRRVVQETEVIRDAPQLLIEYRPRNLPANPESLVFFNEGPSTLRIDSVGPLLWNTTLRREVNLHNVIGPIRANQQAESRFAVFEQIGNSQSMLELPDMLRQVIRTIGHDAQASMEIVYEDMNQRRFSRTFTASIDPYNRVAWDPGPIQRVNAVTGAL